MSAGESPLPLGAPVVECPPPPVPSMASDTPESLMALCTDFCLRNLDGTLGYLLDKETLRLHPDIFLPSEICDRLVNE